MDLYLKHLASPIGELHVYATDRSVVGLFMGSRPFKGCRRPWQEAREADHALLLETAGELDAYFAGRLRSFTVPVEVAGTDFQKAVWESLRTIAYGELRTYGDVARAIDRPAAVRAVGGAIGSNPVSIIIPCHRWRPAGQAASPRNGRPRHCPFEAGTETMIPLTVFEGHRLLRMDEMKTQRRGHSIDRS